MAQKRGISIDWNKAMIPLSLVTMFILWRYGAPIWLLVIFTLWIPLYYIAYPLYLRRRWVEFDKHFAILFQKGDYKALLEYYRSQWFLRRFAPAQEMHTKLALIYSGMEKYREAEHVLERALDVSRAGYRDKLYFNLANVKYELGKYDEAEQMYRALKRSSPYGHRVQTQLALIDLQRGRRVDEARAHLQAELKGMHGAARSRIQDALAQY